MKGFHSSAVFLLHSQTTLATLLNRHSQNTTTFNISYHSNNDVDDDDDDDDGRPSVLEQLEQLRTLKSKEEKTTRRDGVFSRLSSYRYKWVSSLWPHLYWLAYSYLSLLIFSFVTSVPHFDIVSRNFKRKNISAARRWHKGSLISRPSVRPSVRPCHHIIS